MAFVLIQHLDPRQRADLSRRCVAGAHPSGPALCVEAHRLLEARPLGEALDAGRGGRIPALALTAYARIEDGAAAIAAGYQQFATKPIEPAELAAAVATLAGRAGTLSRE